MDNAYIPFVRLKRINKPVAKTIRGTSPLSPIKCMPPPPPPSPSPSVSSYFVVTPALPRGRSRPHINEKLKRLSEILVNYILFEERGVQVFDPCYEYPVLPECRSPLTGLLRFLRKCECLPTECRGALEEFKELTFVYLKSFFFHNSSVFAQFRFGGSGLEICPTNAPLYAAQIMRLPQDYLRKIFHNKFYSLILDKWLGRVSMCWQQDKLLNLDEGSF